MKYCEDYAALLDLFVDGELAAEEMLRVQEHLGLCSGCRAYVDAAFAMRAAFPDAEDTAVPDGFTESVMAAVRLSPRQHKRKTPWVKILTPLAACCAIVILLQSGAMLGDTDNIGALFAAGKSAAPESAMLDMASAPREGNFDAADSASGGAAAQNESKSYAEYSSSTEEAETPLTPPARVTDPEESKTEPAAPQPSYATVLYLPAECMELLEGVTPLDEFDGELHYELDAEAAEALQAQLKDREIAYAVGCGIDPTTDMILVIVEK